MGNLFKDLTAGFSSFVLAWLVPAAVVVALFSVIAYPPMATGGLFDWTRPITVFAESGALAATAVFALAVVVLALITALASRPLYRLLEGYAIPRWVAKPLTRRQALRRRRLEVVAARSESRAPHVSALAREELGLYPRGRSRILPTRLGNALKALETYSSDRFGLDSQTFWYEIYGTAPEQTRRDADSARASVDFFVSLVGLLALLSFVSAVGAALTGSTQCTVLAAASLAATRPAYSAATRNMTDWRYAVQALVNLGRPELAKHLGYQLPARLVDEQDLWGSWTLFVSRNVQYPLDRFDHLRESPTQTPEPGAEAEGASAATG